MLKRWQTSTAIPTKATIVGITSSGTQTGCLLTAGTWSVQTCATYTITTVSGGFTLKTSKGMYDFEKTSAGSHPNAGLCEVNGGILSCSSSVSSGTVFTSVCSFIFSTMIHGPTYFAISPVGSLHIAGQLLSQVTPCLVALHRYLSTLAALAHRISP
jgi:ribonuclease T2